MCCILGLKTNTMHYDFALPQIWLDNVTDELSNRNIIDAYDFVHTSFVWAYHNGSHFGCPFPITPEALEIMWKYPNLFGVHGADNVESNSTN